MTAVQVEEIPVVFQCEGADLVAVVHKPDNAADIGLLTIVAGGPQYRAGVGRGLVSMGRALAAEGIPVMRFDHRGLGDGGGDFRGFEHLEADLRAAVSAFRQQVPEVKQIVLWGGCDAASAIMIHAWNVPEVVSVAVGNPFVSTEATQSAVVRQHYLKRLGQLSFWRKLLRFEFNILEYAKSAIAKVNSRLRSMIRKGESSGEDASAGKVHFIQRMLSGLENFNGPVLFIMSGQSLVSKEFDELTQKSPAWMKAYSQPSNKRVDLPDADQAFSSRDSKDRVNRALIDWIEQLPRK